MGLYINPIKVKWFFKNNNYIKYNKLIIENIQYEIFNLKISTNHNWKIF